MVFQVLVWSMGQGIEWMDHRRLVPAVVTRGAVSNHGLLRRTRSNVRRNSIRFYGDTYEAVVVSDSGMTMHISR